MMQIFKRKKTNEVEQKFDEIQNHVAVSFGNVKQDTSHIFQWLKYFYYRTIEQEKIIQQLQDDIRFVPKSHEEIRTIIDKHYAFENIMQKIRAIEEKVEKHAMEKPVVDLSDVHKRIDKVAIAHEPIMDKIEHLSTRMSEIEKRPSHIQIQEKPPVKEAVKPASRQKENLQERIARKIIRNSKEYIKKVILSMVMKYGKITGTQLREIVVDEQGLASRSSFYRLIGELEEDGEIDIISDGKEKIYLAKLSKTSIQK